MDPLLFEYCLYFDLSSLSPPGFIGVGCTLFHSSSLSHQIFEEGRDLSGEHSQVKEASGDFIVVLGQVAIPQVL